jgi:hypothetical protein
MKLVTLLRSLTAMRLEPSERSEMVSQWLFGELASVIDEVGTWSKIRLVHDGYEGWVDSISVRCLTDYDSEMMKRASEHRMLTPCGTALRDGKINLNLYAGSPLPVFFGDSFEIIGRPFHLTGGDCGLLPLTSDSLCNTAFQFIGAPYLWGGRTIAGMDCSGFTQLLYLLHGQTLPRDASQQVLQGTEVSFVQEAVVGDLAFFSNEQGRIVHVGMVNGKDSIIHASGEVRIDKLDNTGIFNTAQGRYTHQLRTIKRYF